MARAKKINILILSLSFFLVLLIFFIIKLHNYKNYQQDLVKSDNTTETTKEKREFIRKIAPIAQRVQKEYHILASITIAQAILESNWGSSQLSLKYNNYFGIKGNGSSHTVSLETKEFINNKLVTTKAPFMVYDSMEESVVAYAKLLINGTSWNNQQYKSVINEKDYKKASQSLYNSGYSTDPGYSDKLIEIIKKYNLNKYDK